MLATNKIPGLRKMSAITVKATPKTRLSIEVSNDTRWNRDPGRFIWENGFNPVDRQQIEFYGGVARKGVTIRLTHYTPSFGDKTSQFRITSEKTSTGRSEYWRERLVDEGAVVRFTEQPDGSHIIKGSGSRFDWEIRCKFLD